MINRAQLFSPLPSLPLPRSPRAERLCRYSIKNRMIPRVAAMRESGLGRPVFRRDHRAILTFSDSKFEAWLAAQVEARGLAQQKALRGQTEPPA